MAVFVTEHPSDANYRQPATKAPIAAYIINSSVSSSPGPFPQAGTKYIRVSADVASFLNNSTTSTTFTLTSTNSYRIPANVQPELISVSTSFRIQSAST